MGAAAAAPRPLPLPPPPSARTGQAAREPRGNQRVQVGLAGKTGINGLEPFRGAHQQQRRIAAPVCRVRELGAQEVDVGTLEFVQRCGLGHAQQQHRGIERAGLDLGLGRGQSACDPLRRVRGQYRCALEERGRRG